MPSYIFVPIMSSNASNDVQVWQTGQSNKGKAPSQVLASSFSSGGLKGLAMFFGQGCLRDVNAADKLYIYLHGSGFPDGTRVGDTRNDGTQKAYTADELATRLEREGLTKRIGNISVFACGSGLGQTSFARQLKLALVQKGYNPQVTGYLGDVRPSYVSRQLDGGYYTDEAHKGIELGDGFIRRASSYKVTF